MLRGTGGNGPTPARVATRPTPRTTTGTPIPTVDAAVTDIGAGFVMVRKPGKLPAETIEISYEKEYGTDTIQIHKDAIGPDDVVLMHDDLLATGGTMRAACQMVQTMKPRKVYVNFLIELKALHGREVFGNDVTLDTVLAL